MTSSDGYASLKKYVNRLRSERRLLSCPRCDNKVSLSAREFEKHCLSSHGLDPKRSCAWCFGTEEWSLGQKHFRANHLTECFEKFVASNGIAAAGRRRGQSSADDRSSLIKYHVILKRHSGPLPCPACEFSASSASEVERHCLCRHDLDSKRCCVWCLGAESWPSGEKAPNAKHLISCFRNFAAARSSTTTTEGRKKKKEGAVQSDFEPRLLSSKPLCQTRDFFGVADFRAEMSSEEVHPLAFEQFSILDHRKLSPDDGGSCCLVDYYRDENLNAAASYVRLFVETRDSSDWFHVMVKAVAFASFAKAVLADGENTRILPFSCWCDGGNQKEAAKFRQHRHLIAVCRPAGRFQERVWPAVSPSSKPAGGFRAKCSIRIASPLHLVNTLGYLCRRESRCNFTTTFGSKKKKNKKGPVRDKHFHVFESLPEDYALPLSVQWNGGVMELLYQEKFGNVSLARLMESSGLVFEDSRWTQKVGDFYGFEGGRVLSLAKGYAPADDPATATGYCHLNGGRRLRFRYSKENEGLEEAEWLRRQVEGGNSFYEAVGEESWVPRRRDQEKLNSTMPLRKRIRELETEEVARLKNEIENLKRERDRPKKRIRELETEVARLKNEIENLKRERDRPVRELETEVARLKNENENLKRERDRPKRRRGDEEEDSEEERSVREPKKLILINIK